MPIIDQSERKLIVSNYRALLKAAEPLLDREKRIHLKAAFNIMLNAHQRSLYAETEPYFLHSVGVAIIVARDMSMGITSVIASLFAGASPQNEEIKSFIHTYHYNAVETILNKLDTVMQLPTEKVPTNAEHFISLVLSLADDIRVIPILLADRLQYMRNIHVLQTKDQVSIANQTANLYAPLAHRLGLYRIKAELDELSLNYADPVTYQHLKSQISRIESEESAFFESFLQPVHLELQRFGLDYKIKKRTKSVSSAYAKMQKQGIELDEVYDLFAVRIILYSAPENERADCWKAYSAVTSVYEPEPKRLRDWITFPRKNGYESLHITVQGKDGRWVEVQIRTSRMDDDAERGNSAHWRYKGSEGDQETAEWLNSIRQVLEHPEALGDNSTTNQQNKSASTIYVFTPEGDVKKLKPGSTVLDFAFEIHTNLGAHCSGGRVNRKIVPIRHKLKNGDLVEVITSRNQTPNVDWLKWVASSRAKNKIKKYLKEAEFKQAELGKEIFKRKLNQLKINNIDEAAGKIVEYYKLSGSLELYQGLAENKIEPSSIKDILLSSTKTVEGKAEPQLLTTKASERPNRTAENRIIVNQSSAIEGYTLGKCCNPVMGDDIFGFVTVSEGIKIHRSNCPNASRLKARYPYRVMEAEWSSPVEGSYFLTDIKVSGYDQLGILSSITNLISNDLKMDVRSISLNSKDGKFEGYISVSIRDKKHLELLLKKLLTIKGISKASRLATSTYL